MGEWIARTVQGRVRHLYPSHSEGNPIAYLWLHTARCTGPGCGAEVPLASKLWLAKKGERYALRLVPDSRSRRIDVEIIRPKSEADVGAPTVRLGSMTCPIPTCGFTTKKDKVRTQIAEAAGGVANARLASVVVTRSTERGRHFVSPSEADLLAMRRAAAEVQDLSAVRAEVSAIPNEPIPNERVWKNNPIRVHLYGIRTWGDLFNPRQALAMVAFVDAVRKLPEVMRREGVDEATANATAACLSLGVDRMADHLNTLCRWNPSGPKLQNLFSQQAIPFVWLSGPMQGKWGQATFSVCKVLIPIESDPSNPACPFFPRSEQLEQIGDCSDCSLRPWVYKLLVVWLVLGTRAEPVVISLFS